MTDLRIQWICIAFGLLLLIVLLPTTFHTITECRQKHGAVVRHLYWWECIR